VRAPWCREVTRCTASISVGCEYTVYVDVRSYQQLDFNKRERDAASTASYMIPIVFLGRGVNVSCNLATTSHICASTVSSDHNLQISRSQDISPKFSLEDNLMSDQGMVSLRMITIHRLGLTLSLEYQQVKSLLRISLIAVPPVNFTICTNSYRRLENMTHALYLHHSISYR
jgi:hypothetical protein